MSQRKKTPRNKTPKKKMKNDPLYQAVENMIPKPPTKKQRGGGYNFLQEIENMLNGTCGNSNANAAPSGVMSTGKTFQPIGQQNVSGNNDNSTNISTTNGQTNAEKQDSTRKAETTNQYNSNSISGVVKTVGTNYNPKTDEIGDQYITEHDLNNGKVITTIICPKPANTGKESNTNKGGRGKKYITNQRLSENPFSEIL